MGRQYWKETFAYSTADGASYNTSTTETLVWSPAPLFPADYFFDGRNFHFIFQGKYSTTSNPTLRFRLRYGTATGGVTLYDSGTITCATTITNALWQTEVWGTVRSNGSSGTVMCNGWTAIGAGTAPSVGSATGAPGIALGGAGGVTAPAVGTCDFTTATAMSFTALWGTNNASNILIGTNSYFLINN